MAIKINGNTILPDANGLALNANVVLGIGAGAALASGLANTFIGNTAGDLISTGSNNTIIGDLSGSAALTNTVLIGAGTTERLKIDATGMYLNTDALTLTGSSISTKAATALTVDSGTTGALNLGTAASSKTITIGNSTGATSIVVNSGTSGVTFNQVASGILKVQATGAPTTDMVQITNTGQPITTAGVNSLEVTFVGGAAAVEAGAIRTGFTPGTTTGGTWNGYRIIPSAAAATGVTMNGFKFDSITAGAGTDNMIWAGTGWDNILNYNGTAVINGTGAWVGTDIGLAYGGTNASLTAVNGGIVYSNASALAISAAGTAGQVLLSNGANAPYWSDSAPSATSAQSVLATVTGTNTKELVRGNMADNDFFRILVGGTASDAGYVELATADGANEPIYVRQYSGTFTTLTRTATLLDASGNTGFPGTVTGTQLISNVATGTSPLAVTSTTRVANLNADYLDDVQLNTIAASVRSRHNLSGGGIITVDASGYVIWSVRFIVMNLGRGAHFSTAGYYDINCPTTGTVTGVGGATDVTATAAGIPVANWQSLYYILPIGGNNASVAANFRLVGYTVDVEVPYNWVLIVQKNGDTGQGYYFSNGYRLEAGQSIDTTIFDAYNASTVDMKSFGAFTQYGILYASSSGADGVAATAVSTGAGTAGYVLTAQGPGAAPIWAAATGGITEEVDTLQTVTSRGSTSSDIVSIRGFDGYGVGTNSGTTAGSYRFGYQEAGAWAHPYPDLVLGYHTGMKMGGNSGYGGIRFYNDHPSLSSTEIMSIGNGDSHIRIQNNLYVPIVYDLNNTAYYSDPASTSNLNIITLNGTMYFPGSGGAWLTGKDGGYAHIYDSDANNSNYRAFVRTVNSSNTYSMGRLSNSYIGFFNYLNTRTTNGYDGAAYLDVTGNWTISASCRAPIFYDSENTAYYVDPTSSGTSAYLGGDLYVGMNGRTYSDIYMGDSDEGTRRQHCNSNRIGFLNASNGWGSWCHDDGYWQSDQSVRAPIFYDSNNTGYYVDPNGITNLGGVNDRPLRVLKTSGINSACAIFENQYGDNSWGIVGEFRVGSGSGTDRASILFSNGYDTNTWSAGFGGSDSSYFRIRYDHGHRNNSWGTEAIAIDRSSNLFANGSCRSPIFYDSNDTGYYVDPNSTSNMIRWSVYSTNTTSHSYGGSLGSDFRQWPGGTGCAGFSFHRTGAYAVNMALDNDNVIRIGGWSASANRLQMDMSGNLTMAGNVTAYSDIRLKENIETIENSIEKIKQIRGVTFTRNDQDDKLKRYSGVIAQEVEKVLPEVVSEDHEGIKNVAYGNMIGLLIEAIKEQQIQIEQQSIEINKLKSITR